MLELSSRSKAQRVDSAPCYPTTVWSVQQFTLVRVSSLTKDFHLALIYLAFGTLIFIRRHYWSCYRSIRTSHLISCLRSIRRHYWSCCRSIRTSHFIPMIRSRACTCWFINDILIQHWAIFRCANSIAVTFCCCEGTASILFTLHSCILTAGGRTFRSSATTMEQVARRLRIQRSWRGLINHTSEVIQVMLQSILKAA